MKIIIVIVLAISMTGCASIGPALQGLGDSAGRAAHANDQCGSQTNPCNIRVVR